MREDVDAEAWCKGIIVEDSDSMENQQRDGNCGRAPRSSRGANSRDANLAFEPAQHGKKVKTGGPARTTAAPKINPFPKTPKLTRAIPAHHADDQRGPGRPDGALGARQAARRTGTSAGETDRSNCARSRFAEPPKQQRELRTPRPEYVADCARSCCRKCGSPTILARHSSGNFDDVECHAASDHACSRASAYR